MNPSNRNHDTTPVPGEAAPPGSGDPPTSSPTGEMKHVGLGTGVDSHLHAQVLNELLHTTRSGEPGTPAPTDVLKGARVGDCTITRLIGAGGMGAVFEAIQDQPRRTVAVKLIRYAAPSEAAITRFNREAQTLARLSHPGIAQIFVAGSYEHLGERIPFYAMEFIPGARSLTDFAAQKKLSLRQRLELFVEVCEAIHHAHEKGIFHRDLKPQNILVTVDGRPKVIDFGIARAVDSDEAVAGMQTAPDQLLGTLQYMAPEQLDSDPRTIDRRADVYALGVILYEILCGRLPYEVTPSRLFESSRIIREQAPLKPRTANPDLNADLETVMLKALHKERERRYQTARGLADDVRCVLEGAPINARRDSAVYVLRKRVRSATSRHPLGSMLLGALAILVLTELLVTPAAERLLWNRWFERFATTHLTRFDPGPFEHVRIIKLTEQTDLARLGRLTGVAPGTLASLGWTRAVVGQLMTRLAGADVRAVAVDIIYRAPTTAENDAALIRGVEALSAQSIDSVFLVPTWELRPDGSPELYGELAARARWGVGSAGADAESAWRVHLALRREGGEAMPGLALSTLSAARSPRVRTVVQLDPSFHRVHLFSARPMASAVGQAPVTVTGIVKATKADSSAGITKTDDVAEYFVPMPPDSVLEGSGIDVAEALEADESKLRQWFAGKVVLIGGYLQRDQHAYGDGRPLYGCELHAAAINSLLADTGIRANPLIRVPLGWWRLHLPYYHLLDFMLAMGAVFTGYYAGRHRWIGRCLWPLAILAVVAGTSLLLYRHMRVLYFPWTAAVCGLISYAFGLSLAGLRRRSRI